MTALTPTVDNTYGFVRVVADSTIVLDTFSRNVVSGWGSPDVAPAAWTTSGGSIANFSVNGSVGVHTLDSVNVRRVSQIAMSQRDVDITVSVTMSATPTGAPAEEAIVARYVDNSNFLDVRLFISATVTIAVRQMVAGVETVTSFPTVTGATGTSTIFIRLQALGSTLRARAWTSTQSQPATWNVSMTTTWLTAGALQLTSLLEAGNNNALPITASWDNLTFPDDELLYLYRVTPDGVLTAVRNSPVITSGRSAVFIDDEAPLNTTVSYSATSTLSGFTIVTFTSGSVTITGTGGEIGWVKDPIDPTRDVKLNFNTRPYNDCVGQTGITFTDMDAETFADADGVFEVVDYSRPGVVSLTRKSASSNLYFVTMALADAALFETIFATGRLLLVQLPTIYGWAYSSYGSAYVWVGGVTKARLQTQNYKHPHRLWTVPIRITDAPASVASGFLVGSNGVGGGRSTYGTMKASGLTYAQLNATGKTYAQLYQAQGY